jgi:hypothetical protein
MFQDCARDELVDDRPENPRRRLACPAVKHLVWRLALALLHYEDVSTGCEAFLERCPQEMFRHLRRLEWAESIYVEHHRRRRLDTGAPSPSETGPAVGTLRRMLAYLGIDHYREGWRFDPFLMRNELIVTLRAIFNEDIAWPPTYTHARGACIDYWIALILQRFGVEDGETPTADHLAFPPTPLSQGPIIFPLQKKSETGFTKNARFV